MTTLPTATRPMFVMLENVELVDGYYDGPSRGTSALPNTFEPVWGQLYRTSRRAM